MDSRVIVDVIVERCTVSHYTRRHNLNDLELEVQIGWTDCASYIRCWYDVDVVYTPGDMNCFVVDAWPLWRHVEMGIVRSSSFALVSAVQLFPSNIMHGPPRTTKTQALEQIHFPSNSKNIYYQYHISIISVSYQYHSSSKTSPRHQRHLALKIPPGRCRRHRRGWWISAVEATRTCCTWRRHGASSLTPSLGGAAEDDQNTQKNKEE